MSLIRWWVAKNEHVHLFVTHDENKISPESKIVYVWVLSEKDTDSSHVLTNATVQLAFWFMLAWNSGFIYNDI